MPRCEDSWVRRHPAQVTVKVPKPSHGDLYSLTYVNGPKADGPVQPLKSDTFGSDDLADGSATWRVPYDYTTVFTLQTSGTGTLQTTVLIDGQPVTCNSGQHCQGACNAQSEAGVAGFWRVTIWPKKDGDA